MTCEYIESSNPKECLYETIQEKIRVLVDLQGEARYRHDTKTPAKPMSTERLEEISENLEEAFSTSIKALADITPCSICVYKHQ